MAEIIGSAIVVILAALVVAGVVICVGMFFTTLSPLWAVAWAVNVAVVILAMWTVDE